MKSGKKVMLLGLCVLIVFALCACDKDEDERDEGNRIGAPYVTFFKDDESVTLTWESVENADSYDVYDSDGNVIGNTTRTTYTIYNGYINDTSTFVVKACTGKEGFSDSRASNKVTFRKLSAPTIRLATASVKWKAVTGAVGYEIYVGGETYYTTGTSFGINEKFSDMEIYVRAIASDDGNFISSDMSNAVTGNIY